MLDFSYLDTSVNIKKVSLDDAYNQFNSVVGKIVPIPEFIVKNGIVTLLKISQLLFNNNGTNVKLQDLLISISLNDVSLPFIICPDFYNGKEYCIIPVLNDFSGVHNIYMNYLTKAKPISEYACYPIIERPSQSTFREWLSTCVQKYYSHFFGEKSNRIKWELISCKDTIRMNKVYCDTLLCHIQHNQNFIDNFGSDNMFLHLALNMLPWAGYCSDDNSYMICGYDLAKNKYIAGMYVFVFGDRAYLQTIATSKDEEYKPYGLVLAAHYAAVRDLIWTDNEQFKNIKYIDLGCNFDPCMGYKDSMHPEYEPIKNIPNFTSFEELESYL